MIRAITTFRNPIAAVWQYAIHKTLSHRQPSARLELSSSQPEMVQFASAVTALQSGESVPATDKAGIVIGDCAKLAAEYVWAEIRHDAMRAGELENELRYGTCDPLWSIALAIYLAWKASFKPAPYVPYSDLNDFVISLPDKQDLIIGIIADWGTGLDDAKWLLAEVMKKNPDVLLHLGDIYYAGMADECRSNFLELINAAAPNIPVYTLSGNHDMYWGASRFIGCSAISTRLRRCSDTSKRQAIFVCEARTGRFWRWIRDFMTATPLPWEPMSRTWIRKRRSGMSIN